LLNKFVRAVAYATTPHFSVDVAAKLI